MMVVVLLLAVVLLIIVILWWWVGGGGRVVVREQFVDRLGGGSTIFEIVPGIIGIVGKHRMLLLLLLLVVVLERIGWVLGDHGQIGDGVWGQHLVGGGRMRRRNVTVDG